jgi:hypothetical protein
VSFPYPFLILLVFRLIAAYVARFALVRRFPCFGPDFPCFLSRLFFASYLLFDFMPFPNCTSRPRRSAKQGALVKTIADPLF